MCVWKNMVIHLLREIALLQLHMRQLTFLRCMV